MNNFTILRFRVLEALYYYRALMYLKASRPHIGLLRMKWENDYLDGVPTCEVPLKF